MIDRAYEAPAESELGAHQLIIVNTERSLEATMTETLKALTRRAAARPAQAVEYGPLACG